MVYCLWSIVWSLFRVHCAVLVYWSGELIRGLQIRVWVRDQAQERLLDSSFLASLYHNTYPSYPKSFPLWLKPTWKPSALETSLVWNSKIVLVLKSEGPYSQSASLHTGVDHWRIYAKGNFLLWTSIASTLPINNEAEAVNCQGTLYNQECRCVFIRGV